MTTVNQYRYTYSRVEYPVERGYRMEPKPLPDWIYFTITKKGDSKVVTVFSRYHVNKEVVLNPSFSSEYTDKEIIKEISSKIYKKFIKC